MVTLLSLRARRMEAMYQSTCINQAIVLAAQPPSIPPNFLHVSDEDIHHNFYHQMMPTNQAKHPSRWQVSPLYHPKFISSSPPSSTPSIVSISPLSPRTFYCFIPSPERCELENMEYTYLGHPRHEHFMTCGGSIRLSPMSAFSRNHLFHCTVVP